MRLFYKKVKGDGGFNRGCDNGEGLKDIDLKDIKSLNALCVVIRCLYKLRKRSRCN